MKVFLDANVLISVLNKEYPVFSYSSRILSSSNKTFNFYTSPLCLAIAFYFSEKKSGRALAKSKISTLCKHIGISAINKDTVNHTLGNKKILDFEDGLEYYSAMAADCKCIITEDNNDFYFSEVEVLNSKSFFEKHLKK